MQNQRDHFIYGWLVAYGHQCWLKNQPVASQIGDKLAIRGDGRLGQTMIAGPVCPAPPMRKLTLFERFWVQRL